MATSVALIGAGGKMGTRIGNNLSREASYRVVYAERAAGLARLAEQGRPATDPAQAAAQADFVVLAVPDARIRTVSAELVPLVRAGATVVLLDPAAAAAVFRLPGRPRGSAHHA